MGDILRKKTLFDSWRGCEEGQKNRRFLFQEVLADLKSGSTQASAVWSSKFSIAWRSEHLSCPLLNNASSFQSMKLYTLWKLNGDHMESIKLFWKIKRNQPWRYHFKKYKYYSWGCLLGRLRSSTPSPSQEHRWLSSSTQSPCPRLGRGRGVLAFLWAQLQRNVDEEEGKYTESTLQQRQRGILGLDKG